MAPTVSRGNKPRASHWQGIRSLRCTATAVTLLSLWVPVGFSEVRVNVVPSGAGKVPVVSLLLVWQWILY